MRLHALAMTLLLQLAAAQFPGPKVTEIENGQEVWKAQRFEGDDEVITYTVRDHGTMRPTLVYNCAKAPSLCKTVAKHFGGSVGTGTYHYDADYRIRQGDSGQRKSVRRNDNCPSSWIDGRCPEADQPRFYAGARGFADALMYRGRNADREPDDNRLAEEYTKRLADGSVKTMHREIGAVLSCDEWPAASWIEGGSGGATYCSPIGQGCGRTRAVQTDQNWQAQAHNAIGIWSRIRSPADRRNADTHDPEYTIFKFDFRTVDDNNNGYATWVEANGHKRYCYGPDVGDKSDCKPAWDDDPAVPE
ncbi:hypothetical protein ASPVEDRAFT_77909 [Aspergillus versicolor CBS 583.65]|uniref:Ecp2 effector protein domain-containing protein n=1 Tax=Aspergillus versicolor CBS 583.65 TaxID=1036611 RepID=A0A1L9P3L4_ASPVE|nr:uncharacterized protein ASPVEDRAFT_77909 [Aspergillus versicolor CBS 583.65]OJI96127.1 hypothetical protein ASPVEDRAFT_77909 [Aspergillus versicolor CBS 583.65]